jgi:threonine dehydrogenase-like Zn-dependent dehydrogenase
MRAPFQSGDFPGPVKYGYINVGIVESGPLPLAGRHVFCLYPHQTRYVVPAEAVAPLPPGVPPGRAVLAANAETALNGLWDAEPQPGSRITVIGAGTLGCLVARFSKKTLAAEVELIDIDPARESLAQSLGVAFATPERASGNVEWIFHTSGAPAGLRRALEIAAFEATIVEMSWFGDQVVELPLGEAFHSRRLTIRSSQVGSVARSKRADISHRERLLRAIDLLDDAALDALISPDHPFEALPDLMRSASRGRLAAPCNRIVYDRG